MRKAILIALVMGLLGGGAAVVAAQVSDDSTTTKLDHRRHDLDDSDHDRRRHLRSV